MLKLAGIASGTIINQVGDVRVNNIRDMARELAKAADGDQLVLKMHHIRCVLYVLPRVVMPIEKSGAEPPTLVRLRTRACLSYDRHPTVKGTTLVRMDRKWYVFIHMLFFCVAAVLLVPVLYVELHLI